LIANNKRDSCDLDVCDPDVKQSYDSMRMVSTVAFYAGVGLAVGGLVMFLTAPSDDAAVSFRVGPGSAAVSGRF
jgi:hypothetical protein